MLKAIPPTTNCGYFKSKCAEIHYQTTNFSILCIFCGMTTHSYGDFLEHFRSQHFQDFVGATVQITAAETVVTPIYEGNDEDKDEDSNAAVMDAQTTKRRRHHDPLDFGDREITADPEELMQTLLMQEDQFEVKQLKCEEIESSATATLAKNNHLQDQLSAEKIVVGDRRLQLDDGDEEFNESDEEYLICKVKVEQCDLQAAKPTKRRRARKRLTRIKREELCHRGSIAAKVNENTFTTTTTTITTQMPAIAERLQMLAENDDRENAVDANAADHNEDNEEVDDDNDNESEHDVVVGDIDWTQPYEPNQLRQHEKRPYKPRNKPNTCSYCGRTFRRRYQLDTHLNIHTGRKPHQCDICGRLFRAVTTLTRHLSTHTQRDAYQCRFCAKSFTHKAALLSHELRHTQERRVPCDKCAKLFYTLNQMDTHKRKVHQKSGGDNSGAGDNTALPFACDLCTKRYRSASMLSTHKFKKHYKTAKFVCEQCGKKFIDPQQLESHKRIHVVGLAVAVSTEASAASTKTQSFENVGGGVQS